MLLDTDRTRLQHMIAAIEQAMQYAEGCSRADMETSTPLQHLFARNVEIVGEAASRISPALRAAHPDIPWGKIIGMRNRIVHVYFEVDFGMVWSTVQQSFPMLLPRLKAMLAGETQG